MDSTIEPVSSPTPPDPPKPALRGNRRRRIVALLTIVSLLGIIWCIKFRGTGWTQALNPINWFHDSRKNELYISETPLLQRGNPDLPEIALTFDDGPHSESRVAILDTLNRFGVHATFFDVGSNMDRYPELVLRTLEEGHEIANHTQNHQRLDGLTVQQRHREINDADITYYRVVGKHLSLLRPPGMRYTDSVLADTRDLGYIVVGYTNAAKDFELNESSSVIAERSLSHLANGSILLLHDYPSTSSALPAILEGIQKQGYRCVTISEMLQHLPVPMQARVQQFQQKVNQ